MMDYTESLLYLRDLTKFGFNFGLDRVKELLRRLGNPEKTMTYIHVGGTNGKGSITSMIHAMLIAAGENPGMFTSPHLHSYRERFQIGGEMISHDEVAGILNEIKPHIDAMIADGFEQPTEFEVNTVMAFLYFAKKGVKIAVMEVGMGGEIDATNVIENVKVAVLVNVALEHTEYLGDTKEKICLTKSGIIKKDCHLVSGCSEPELQELLKKRVAEEKAKDVSFLHQNFGFNFEGETAEVQTFTYYDNDVQYHHLQLPLRGRHQLGNAAMAIRVARLFGLDERAIREGLAQTTWPCRLEKVTDQPLTIIDGAHNDHGMAVLTSYLKDHYLDKTIVVLIGMLADKERQKAVDLLGPLAGKVVITKPHSPRAGNYEMIADFFKPYCSEIYLEKSIPQACELAQNLANDIGENALLLITGSLYMVADARGYLLGIESE
jgi:dihydrofolate synthase/folylpolyglutamate synthase